jgi:hypothetical protein
MQSSKHNLHVNSIVSKGGAFAGLNTGTNSIITKFESPSRNSMGEDLHS